jgi:hypothetical protein
MNRYQFLKKNTEEPIAYCFKSTNSVLKTFAYMKKCIQDSVMFQADNIQESVLHQALIKLSRMKNVPIITESKEIAQRLSIAYSYDRIYSVKDIPRKYGWAIYYWDINNERVPETETFLVIRKNKG